MGVDYYFKDCVVDRRDRIKGNLWMFEGRRKGDSGERSIEFVMEKDK